MARSHYNHRLTPPCREHAPRRDAAWLYDPSRHCAVAPGGTDGADRVLGALGVLRGLTAGATAG
jgi:hypothetical protein